MRVRVRLLRGSLHYRDEIRVHTASSGAVSRLDELYLVLDRDGDLAGLGGVRINIAYASGLDAEALAREAQGRVAALDWTMAPFDLLDAIHRDCDASAPVRSLIDQTLHDTIAREHGQSLAELLGGGSFARRVATNQCLFWNDDVTFERLAAAYVARGFRDLKVRVGVGEFERDLARLRLLRERFVDDVRLSADANGRWDVEDALRYLEALAPLHLDYVEQPVAGSDWGAVEKVVRGSPIPIMLDESLGSPESIEKLLALDAPVMAHLKLVKQGGIRPLIETGQRLAAASVETMVGQMNEGGVATAAAAHCALALRPRHAELYGADGLVDEPAPGLRYEDGCLVLPEGPGIAVQFDPAGFTQLWETTP
jgi:L-alanine-DL-glutamate epimerase-like enolase superfamily enzyme